MVLSLILVYFFTSNFDWGKNVVISGVDISSSVHIDSKVKDILVLAEGVVQGLDDTSTMAEAKYSINFSRSGRYFICIIMETAGFYLLLSQKYSNSKKKTLK